MLHQIKRTVGLAQQPLKGPANAEYLNLRQRLSAIKSALKYTSDMLDYANKGWILQMQAQRTFSERFAESYPTPGDEMHLIASQFAEGSQRLYDHFIRKANPDMTAYHNIHQQVTVYIREIESVEAYHSRLIAAKSEADRYQSKIDHMERKKKQADDTKKTRNLLKMDVEKVNYRKLLNEAIAKQKATYAKYPVVFKAALVSYWLSHEKHVTMLVESLKETQAFAKAAEAEMARLDIRNLEVPFKQDIHVVQNMNFDMDEEQKQREHLQEMSSSFGKLAMPKVSTRRSSVGMNSTISDAGLSEKSRLMKTRSLLQSPADTAGGSQDRRLLRAHSMGERTLEAKRSVNVENLEQARFAARDYAENSSAVKEQERKKALSAKNEQLVGTLATTSEEQEKALPAKIEALEETLATKTEEMEKSIPVKEMLVEEGRSAKAVEITTTGSLNTDASQRSISSGEQILSENSSEKETMAASDMVDLVAEDKDVTPRKKINRDEGYVGKDSTEKDDSAIFKDAETKMEATNAKHEEFMVDESDVVRARSVKVIAGIYEAGGRKATSQTTQKGL